jgi:putative FmdB family regulatory protein
MPNYEFLCKNCKTVFLKIMTYEEYEKNEKVRCPHCNKKAKRTILTAPKITFLGDGFYINDSKDVKKNG